MAARRRQSSDESWRRNSAAMRLNSALFTSDSASPRFKTVVFLVSFERVRVLPGLLSMSVLDDASRRSFPLAWLRRLAKSHVPWLFLISILLLEGCVTAAEVQ